MFMEPGKFIINLSVFKENSACIFCWPVRYNLFCGNNSLFACKIDMNLQTPFAFALKLDLENIMIWIIQHHRGPQIFTIVIIQRPKQSENETSGSKEIKKISHKSVMDR